jgi:hypothetical protein
VFCELMTIAAKLIPTVLLAGILLAGVTARPPRTPVTPRELIRFVAAGLVLYLVGGAALLAHRTGLAGVGFGAGLALCALALWLSRGGTPPTRDDDGGPEPPAYPTPPVDFDWSYYEDQVQDLRSPKPTTARRAPTAGRGSGSPPRAPGERTAR